MNTYFRKAEPADRARILEIYDHIFEAEEKGPVICGWKRGFYPTEQTADDGLRSGEMVVLVAEGRVVGSARFNSVQDEIFSKARWEASVPDSEVLVLHTLTVDPAASGHGYGLKFLTYYEQLAREKGCTELRMDTGGGNSRARRIYREAGFTEADSLSVSFHPDGPVHTVLFLEKHLAPEPLTPPQA